MSLVLLIPFHMLTLPFHMLSHTHTYIGFSSEEDVQGNHFVAMGDAPKKRHRCASRDVAFAHVTYWPFFLVPLPNTILIPPIHLYHPCLPPGTPW